MQTLRLIAAVVVIVSLVGCQKEQAVKPDMKTLKIKNFDNW
jgi:hypothetical protein